MHGTYKHEYPRGWAMRGWNPQSPLTGLSTALPVKTSNEVLDTANPILAGMLITPSDDKKKWIKGVKAGTKPNLLCFAQNHSTDPDVAHANSLVGLSCSGNYRFATPFFVNKLKDGGGAGVDTQQVYLVGTALTFAENDEVDIYMLNGVPTERSAAGFLRVAKTGEPVIGVVAEDRSGSVGNYGAANPAHAYALQKSFTEAVDSTAHVDNAYLVIWDCSYHPTV